MALDEDGGAEEDEGVEGKDDEGEDDAEDDDKEELEDELEVLEGIVTLIEVLPTEEENPVPELQNQR